MPLTKGQKRYLYNQSAVAAVMNFVMNGLMAWLIFRPAETVPVLGSVGFAVDVIMTTFFFTFFTSFLVSRAAHKKISSGQLAAVDSPSASRLFAQIKPRPFIGSLTLAVGEVCLVASIVLAIFWVLEIDHLTLLGFVAFKSLYGAGLGAIAAPLIALVAMMETSHLT